MSSGGSKGGMRDAHLPGVKVLSISCSFWANLTKSYVGAPWRVGAPTSGKSWIRHWWVLYLLSAAGYSGWASDNSNRSNKSCLFTTKINCSASRQWKKSNESYGDDNELDQRICINHLTKWAIKNIMRHIIWSCIEKTWSSTENDCNILYLVTPTCKEQEDRRNFFLFVKRNDFVYQHGMYVKKRLRWTLFYWELPWSADWFFQRR